MSTTTQADFVKDIAKHCNQYKGADTAHSVFQLVTTLALFGAVLGGMFYALDVSYILAGVFALVGAGLLTRIFVLQHDCGHGSFFKSKPANTWVGRVLGVLTLTPYDAWRRSHNMHHATSGNLDRRSTGAVDTITVEEYKSLSRGKQIFYRVYRHPLFLMFFGSPIYMGIIQRIPFKQSTVFHEGYKSIKTEKLFKSIMYNNIAIIVFYGALFFAFGAKFLLFVYLPVFILTTWIGTWLFFIQHQFEDAHWEQQAEWDVQEAALMGSSYYALPKVLQWFSGSIGLHHIHHLCSQIPNYKLQACMDARPELAEINKLTLTSALSCFSFKLWDPSKKQMVGFAEI